MARGVPSFLYPGFYLYTRAGPSELSPVWRGPFAAIPSIGAETGAVSIMSMIWNPVICTVASC